MTDSQTKGQKGHRFETPLMDSLKPQHQHLVVAYCELLDKEKAAYAAGYTNNHHQLKRKVKELFSDPKIVAAIDEYLEKKLEQLDSSRAQLCAKLMNQALADITDVAIRVPYVNGFGKAVDSKYTWLPKPEEEVEQRFRCAMSFLTQQRDSTYTWDNMAQHRAATLLSKLMMWDQSILDQNPALIFNFGEVRDKPYEAPSHGVDMSVVEAGEDEIDKIIAH